MKNSVFALSLLLACSISLFTACQGSTGDNGSNAKADSTKTATAADSTIDEFPLRESIMTASQSYKITSSDDTTEVSYLSLNTSVQWPEALGDFKIDVLRDSIVHYTFGSDADKDVRKAIKQSVNDVAQYGFEGKIEKVATVPESAETNSYYSTKTLQLIECTQQTVTYTSSFSEYLGGAHPNSGAYPFSFVLATDQPVTMSYLFTNGEEAWKTLLPKVLETLAASYSMSVDELRNALQASPKEITDNVYLLNGMIAFHYNPYDILPYSYGSSEALIAPYEVSDLLTPAAKELLLQ